MTLSRRTFLQTMATLPLATTQRVPRVAVFGAGAFGGWTALHLRRLGAEVTLIDAWGPGNSRSSSGGESRVIRAVYGGDRIYVEMVRRSFELWEEIDSSARNPLYVPTGALWLHRGEDHYVQAAVPILTELGFPIDQLAVADAARRYSQIDFSGVKSVWMEKRAGALAARRACLAVRDAFVAAGGVYRIGQAESPRLTKKPLASVRLTDGSNVQADFYVFACGPWLGRVFPEAVGENLRATRQEVYYFGTPTGSDRYLPARLPVWIDFGERIVYGVPDIQGRGLKIADDTRGEPFDPTNGDRRVSDEGVERARRYLAERFPEMAKAPLLSAEVCQYENSPDGHLILDRHPAARNVFLAGGGSGHAFKLGPAIGELIAGAVLGKQELPATFGLARLRGAGKPKTQFERASPE